MGYDFFTFLYRLRYIERWSLMRNTHKESVAVHSFDVAVISHMLCTIGNEIFHKEIPTEKVVALALFHDATEVFVGDVAHPVKHSNEVLLRHFREIERTAAERLMQMLPEQLKKTYRPLVQEHDPEIYRWVKASDLIAAYLKCKSEISAGNKEFSVAEKQLAASLKKLDMPEVDYFLKTMASGFDKTIDELT
ncbi:MAG TPA: 5'-deoxynucleotidase [Bacilli bacterium]